MSQNLSNYVAIPDQIITSHLFYRIIPDPHWKLELDNFRFNFQCHHRISMPTCCRCATRTTTRSTTWCWWRKGPDPPHNSATSTPSLSKQTTWSARAASSVTWPARISASTWRFSSKPWWTWWKTAKSCAKNAINTRFIFRWVTSFQKAITFYKLIYVSVIIYKTMLFSTLYSLILFFLRVAIRLVETALKCILHFWTEITNEKNPVNWSQSFICNSKQWPIWFSKGIVDLIIFNSNLRHFLIWRIN